MPRTNLNVTDGDECSLHFDPEAATCDALALMNHAPSDAGDGGGFEAGVKLETALVQVRKPTGELELCACIAAFATDTIHAGMEITIDYGYDMMARVKFKPRYRQPFSRLQHTTKVVRFYEAQNQGQRMLASMIKMGMRPDLPDLMGPVVKEVVAERSRRTGAVVLAAQFPTVMDANHTSEQTANAARALRKKVLEN